MSSFDISMRVVFPLLVHNFVFHNVDTNNDGIWHLSHSEPKAQHPYVTVHVLVLIPASNLCGKLE